MGKKKKAQQESPPVEKTDTDQKLNEALAQFQANMALMQVQVKESITAALESVNPQIQQALADLKEQTAKLKQPEGPVTITKPTKLSYPVKGYDHLEEDRPSPQQRHMFPMTGGLNYGMKIERPEAYPGECPGCEFCHTEEMGQ